MEGLIEIIMAKDLDSFLEGLEAHEDLRFGLEARVSVAIFDCERALCGQKNGDVCLLTISKDIAKLESSSLRNKVTCLCWAGVGKCVSGHENGPSRLWDLSELKEIAVLDDGDRAQEEFDTAAAVDANSKVVLGSSTGSLRLWDWKQLKQIVKVKAYPEAIYNACFVGDKWVTISTDAVKVWDLSSLQELATLKKEAQIPYGMTEIAQGGRYLFSVWNNILIWDFKESTDIPCYKGHKGRVKLIKMIDDDRCVSCEDEGYITRMWNTKDLLDIYQLPFETYDADVKKNLLYCATADGLSVVNINVNQVVVTINLKLKIAFVHSFEGKCLCIPELDNSVSVLELDQHQQEYDLIGQTDGVICTLAWGPDKLMSGAWDNTLRVWDVNHQRELGVMSGHPNGVMCLAVTTDNRCISGDCDGNIKVWDLSNMKEILTHMKHPETVLNVIVTNNRKAITGDAQCNIFVWDLDNYTKIAELKGHTDKVTRLLLISDEVMISGSVDKTVRVWDVQHCTALATLEGHEKAINWIALASNNRCISASNDKTMRVWDLQKYKELTTLKGHTDNVNVIAVDGEKCASGSKDKTIIFWDLTNYIQKTKVTCSYEVHQLIFTNNTQLVSGDEGGEVKVWEDYREVATFGGYFGRNTSISLLSNFRIVSSKLSFAHNLNILDLGQLSSCLSQCKNRKVLEKEMSENKPLYPQYRSRISDFRSGNRVPQPESQMLFRPYFFNALHLCAYYNHSTLLKEYLKEEVPLVCGVFGSPLKIAIEKKTIGCVDVILEYLIAVAPQVQAWKSFQTINDDLVPLLGCESSMLEAFFSVLMQCPLLQVPTFINPLVQLPTIVFAPHTYIPDLGIYTPGHFGEDLVKFSTSLVNWNLIAGSQESIKLLTAAVECDDRRVFLGDFLRFIVIQKWDNCFPFTLTVSIAYGILLGCLIGIVNLGSNECCIGYLILNCFFLLYEILQLIAMKSKYFTEGWNLIDIVRCALSITWAIFTLMNYNIEKHIVMLVVFFDFIRGFTYFRSFRMTRVFVYMTFTVVAEMYSFLLIIAYSVFAFGMFTSILLEENSLAETWKKAYNLTMGNYDTGSYGTLEWIIFTGSTVTNIIIMMNLLISILGEAYEKVQMTMLENDMHIQASLLLEYETLMIWRRRVISKIWIVTCRSGVGGEEQTEWSGRVLQIVNSLSDGLTQVKGEVREIIGRAVKDIDTKTAKIDAKVVEIKSAAAETDRKIEGIEKKLDAVLSLLHSRS